MTEQNLAAVAAAPDETRFKDLMIEEILATIALAIVVGSVSWGVLTRYVLTTPANWSGELASIGFAWAVFLGSAAAFRRSSHIVIDTFLFIFPPAMARGMQIASALVTLVVLVVMTGLAARFTLSTLHVPTTVLRLPQATIYAAAAVGFGLMALRHVMASYENLFKKAWTK
jgi:TRAP-type C4-dicarboxylate transport system permease small subunit